MRTVVLLLFVALACRGPGAREPGVEQYRAWCWSRSRPLGDWTTDRAAAQAQLDEHLRRYPHHRATVKVWTGPLSATGASAGE